MERILVRMSNLKYTLKINLKIS